MPGHVLASGKEVVPGLRHTRAALHFAGCPCAILPCGYLTCLLAV